MEFWKMNGAGNDFIVVDDRQDAIPDEKWPEIIRTVCERHMSIGLFLYYDDDKMQNHTIHTLSYGLKANVELLPLEHAKHFLTQGVLERP